MYKGKVSVFVALGILGGLFYVGLQLTNAQSVSVTTAPASHVSCVPDKDYPNSNGYVESYTRPNKCHSKKVFYNYGTNFQMGDCGNAPWCYWRVRCPAGTSAYTHSSGGGWHVSMSPNINGAYDGPAHVFCADASGNQYDPIPGESDANPNHSHSVYQTGYQSLAKAVVVDTNQTYFYSYKDSKWYDCPAGATGPHEQASYRDIQTGSFPNHYHCINGQQNLTDSDTSNDNSEAPPVLQSAQPSWEVVGSGFGTQDDTTTARDQFVDKSTNWGQTPLGTVRCVSTVSDKVYFSTTGTCPAASQFPAKASYAFELVKLAGPVSVAANPGATGTFKFSLKNTGNVDTEFPVYCDSGYGSFMGNMYYLNADGSNGSKFLNPGAFEGTTSVPSANVVLMPGVSKSFAFVFNIPEGNMSVGGWTAKCYTYPMNLQTRAVMTEKKLEISAPFSVTMPSITTTTGTPATVTVTALTQYGNNKYNLKVEDADGLKEFSIKKAGGASIYGGSPGASGSTGACGGANTFKSVDSGTVTLETSDFPLSASVTDCRTGATAYAFSVSSPTASNVCSSLTLVLTDNKTSYSGSDMVNYRYTCVPAGTRAQSVTVQVVKPDGTATTYNTGTNADTASMGFSVSNLAAGNYTLRACLNSAACAPGSVYSVPFTVGSGNTIPPESNWTKRVWNFTDGSAESYILNRTDKEYLDYIASVASACSKISKSKFAWKSGAGNDAATNWQYFGIPDCSGTGTGGNGTTTPPIGDQPRSCAPGETCPKGSWCTGGGAQMMTQQCYFPDARMTCASGPMSTGSSWTPLACPAGTSACSPTDKSCKQKGDKWTAEEERTQTNGGGFYCMGGRECSLSGGGGTCVGTNDTCPTGTTYCGAMPGISPDSCGEPDTTKSWTRSDNQSYFMCGAGDLDFHNATTKQAYCPPTRSGGFMAWDGPSVKAILNKLGSGWGLCEPGDSKCIEPGKTGPSDSWCGWMQPNSVAAMTPPPGGTRKCPSLDDVIPPGPDPQNCPITLNPAVASCLPGHIMQTSTNPDGCPVTKCVPEPEVRECKPGEMSYPTSSGTGACMMPMYKWNIAGKKWEKCENKYRNGMAESMPFYGDVMNNPKATHTACQSFYFDIEEAWRTQRFLVRPPEKYGEWYMPPWDAATRQLQYNPKTDQLEECRKNNSPATTMMTPGQYYAPCSPTPSEDEKWMLLKSRAEYKMHQMWSKQLPPVPGPGDPVLPNMPIIPLPEKPLPPLPEVPAGQCKAHITSLRNQINADKRFWKDTNRQLEEVTGIYAEAGTVRELLDTAKALILDIEKVAKSGKCSPENLKDIQAKSNTLHQDLFAEVSVYLADMYDAAEYGKCVHRFDGQTATLQKLLTKNLDDETKADVTALVQSVESKQAELKEHRDDLEYDVNFECREFASSLESQVAPLLLAGDQELNRIVEDIVSEKFKPVIAELREQLANKGKQLDELMVQIAELHQAVETISTAANQISEKITVSYTALAKIEEKFEKEKAEIQTAKDRLIPLVEQAIGLIKETGCVPRGQRESIVQEFGTVASVNWFGERANELERRLDSFIASCRAQDVAATDIKAFRDSIADASSQNQRASYDAGLTPFPDVPTHVWYYSGMLTGHRAGFITQGRPGEDVLRQDALLMVLRAAGVGDDAIKGECAVPAQAGIGDVSKYARCAVKYAWTQGLSLGGSMTVPVSRVEVAQWIAKLTKLPRQGDEATLKAYTDIRGIDFEPLDAVRSVVASDVMVGQVGPSSSTFQPYASLTRSALAVMLEKLLGIR